jgi:hypothetical protein
MRTKLIISGLAFLALTTIVGAQNNGLPTPQRNSTSRGVAYVDANKDGICDNYENSASSDTLKRPVNGRCCGMGQGQHGMRQGQQGMRRKQGRSINFVDADKNGVCDYFEASSKK